MRHISCSIGLLLVFMLFPFAAGSTGSAHSRVLTARSWTGAVTVTIRAFPEGTGDNGTRWEHRIKKTVRWYGSFTPYKGRLLVHGWKMTTGRAVGEIDDEAFEVASGTKTRSTLQGRETVDLGKLIQFDAALDSVTFALGSDGSYTLQVPELKIKAASTTYEPNNPKTVLEGPTVNTHTIPGARLWGLPHSSAGTVLSGTRTFKAMVFGAAGDGTMLDVVVDWKIASGAPLAPLKPIR